MSLPIFPAFKKFSLQHDYEEYLYYYSQLSVPYCDLSPNDLLIWLDFHDDIEVSTLNGILFVRFSNVFNDSKRTYSMLGKGDLGSAIQALFLYQIIQGEEQRIEMVPAEMVETLSSSEELRIEEDLGNDDYAMYVPTGLKMEGKLFENQRRRINRFNRSYPTAKVQELDLHNTQTRTTILDIIKKWTVESAEDHNNDPEQWELRAIKKHLELVDALPVFGQMITVDDQPANISIFHFPPQEDWLIFNHIKSDYTYEDIYNFSFYQVLVTAQQKGKKWVNFEQDLGKPGLREAKRRLRAQKFLRRYTLTPDPERKYQ